jgi:hypothetical protein
MNGLGFAMADAWCGLAVVVESSPGASDGNHEVERCGVGDEVVVLDTFFELIGVAVTNGGAVAAEEEPFGQCVERFGLVGCRERTEHQITSGLHLRAGAAPSNFAGLLPVGIVVSIQ